MPLPTPTPLDPPTEFVDICYRRDTATLMQDLGLRMRMTEAGDTYGMIYIESTSGREVADYDLLEKKLHLRRFNNLTEQFPATLMVVNERFNITQLRNGRLPYMLQRCHDLFVEWFPDLPTTLFGDTWALTVAWENTKRSGDRTAGAYLKLRDCLELAEIYPNVTAEEIKTLIEETLPVSAIHALHEDLAVDLLHELYGKKDWGHW